MGQTVEILQGFSEEKLIPKTSPEGSLTYPRASLKPPKLFPEGKPEAAGQGFARGKSLHHLTPSKTD